MYKPPLLMMIVSAFKVMALVGLSIIRLPSMVKTPTFTVPALNKTILPAGMSTSAFGRGGMAALATPQV